jgi:hypothetical protein
VLDPILPVLAAVPPVLDPVFGAVAETVSPLVDRRDELIRPIAENINDVVTQFPSPTPAGPMDVFGAPPLLMSPEPSSPGQTGGLATGSRGATTPTPSDRAPVSPSKTPSSPSVRTAASTLTPEPVGAVHSDPVVSIQSPSSDVSDAMPTSTAPEPAPSQRTQTVATWLPAALYAPQHATALHAYTYLAEPFGVGETSTATPRPNGPSPGPAPGGGTAPTGSSVSTTFMFGGLFACLAALFGAALAQLTKLCIRSARTPSAAFVAVLERPG